MRLRELRRQGLDLVKLLEKQNLAFLDGLSALFHQDDRDQDSTRRGLRGKSKRSVLTDSSIESLEKSIFTAINSLKEENQNSKRIVLVLDGLDLLLASTATDAEMMMDLLAELREVRLFFKFYLITRLILTLACSFYYCNLRCRFGFDSVYHHSS